MSEKQSENLSKSLSLIQIGRRALLLLGVLALVLIGLWMWLSWKNLRQMQLQRMTIAASLAAYHSQSYFDTVGGHLDSLAEGLNKDDGYRQPAIVHELLQTFKAKHPDLGGVSVIAPSGQMLYSTALKPGTRLPDILEKPEWRADFLQNLQAPGLSLNKPQRGYLLGAWIIPLRFTVHGPRGEVRFVLQTSILLSRQQALWANLGLQTGVEIGLLREDGVLLSAWPLPDAFPANRHSNRSLLDAVANNVTNGFFSVPASAWGDRREGVYQRLRGYPAYIFLSIPNSYSLQFWWRTIQAPTYTFLLLFLLITIFYAVIARRFGQRMQLVQAALGRDYQDGAARLPSSGVAEIDALCAALAEAQQKLLVTAKTREQQLLSAADAGTYTLRLRDGRVLDANDAFLEMLGRTRESVVNHPWAALFEAGYAVDGNTTGLHPNQELSLRVLRFKHGLGHPVWLSLAEFIDADGREPLRQGLAFNVSQREELLAKVQVHSERLRALWRLATDRDSPEGDKLRQMLRLGLDTLGMESSILAEETDGLLQIRLRVGMAMRLEEGESLPVSSSLCQNTVRSKQSQFIDDLAGRQELRFNRLVAECKVRAFVSAPVWAGDGLFGTLSFYDRRPRARPFSEEDRVFVELLAAWFGKVLLEQRQHRMLETLAMTDSLTGLPNRRAAEEMLASELARAKRGQESFSVVICDLDRFKLINDHFGHHVGDQVLCHVSGLMRAGLREGDWVARWGGEEFLIFLHQSSGQEAYNTMERLREDIKTRPLQTPHGSLVLTGSFGIGVFHTGGAELTQVLSEADGCLYEAKRLGRDRVVLGESMRKGRLWQAGTLQQALRDQRIVAAYQVMISLETGRVVAEEALARLIEPDGKVRPAADFVEAAEGINLIHHVDEIVARQAIQRYSEQVADATHGGIAHFINLSPQYLARRDLLDGLLEEAKRLSQGSGNAMIAQHPVVFEITERQLMEDFSSMRENLKHLLDYGFRLALDDFGSGYSSFLYLAELPISYLKIEGWMVRNMQYNDRILSMVRSVVMLAKTLGMTTIAECVEDARTAALLREMGVDWAQGYYYGHPTIAEQAPAAAPVAAAP